MRFCATNATRTPIFQPIDQATVDLSRGRPLTWKLALGIIAGPDVQDSVGWRLSLHPARHSI